MLACISDLSDADQARLATKSPRTMALRSRPSNPSNTRGSTRRASPPRLKGPHFPALRLHAPRGQHHLLHRFPQGDAHHQPCMLYFCSRKKADSECVATGSRPLRSTGNPSHDWSTFGASSGSGSGRERDRWTHRQTKDYSRSGPSAGSKICAPLGAPCAYSIG